MVSVPARRGQVVYATGRGLSQRRACTLVQARTVCPAVSIAEGGQERGGDRTDAGAFGAVSALWLPARAHLSGSRRLRDEPWPGASVVACGKTPGAAQAPTKAYCELATTTTDAGRAEPGMGFRLRVRCKPWQNGVNESFNGKFRDECLSFEWFRSRAEAKIVIENWRRHFNTVRPHSSLDYQTPAEFTAKLKEQTSASMLATGRDAAVYGAFAPRPVAQTPRKGHQEPPARDAVSS